MPGSKDQPDRPVSPEAWEQAPTLTTIPGLEEAQLVSDGGGLPFAPGCVLAPSDPLDPDDPAVRALLSQIDQGRQQAQPARLLRPRAKPAPITTSEKLAGWRQLARTEDEALFGRGAPPQLLTVAVRRGWRNRWSPLGASNARELRAVRDGIRASSWRLDPSSPPDPDTRELRILVTERTMASGAAAAGRLLEPELYLDDRRAVLRVYIKPIEGYVGRTRRHETPVIVRLPDRLGDRELCDGARYEPERR